MLAYSLFGGIQEQRLISVSHFSKKKKLACTDYYDLYYFVIIFTSVLLTILTATSI